MSRNNFKHTMAVHCIMDKFIACGQTRFSSNMKPVKSGQDQSESQPLENHLP